MIVSNIPIYGDSFWSLATSTSNGTIIGDVKSSKGVVVYRTGTRWRKVKVQKTTRMGYMGAIQRLKTWRVHGEKMETTVH